MHLITKRDLKDCPEPVFNYLVKAGVLGKSRKLQAHITHDGQFRLKPNQSWFPIKGEYLFKPEAPSFEWKAKIKVFPLVFISVKDEYNNGVGRSHVKLQSLFTIVDQAGDKTSESSLGRLLVELVLIPTALVPSKQLYWEAIDSNHALVVLKSSHYLVEAVFEFNSEGLPVKTSIDRFGNFDGKVKKNTFVCELSNFKLFEDLLIPTDIIGSWNLEWEMFSWLNFKIKSVHFDERQL